MAEHGFTNDGSFMEKFQEMQKAGLIPQSGATGVGGSRSELVTSAEDPSANASTGTFNVAVGKSSGSQKPSVTSNSGTRKLAFGIKPKVKPVFKPVFSTPDEEIVVLEEEKRDAKRAKVEPPTAAPSTTASRNSAPPAAHQAPPRRAPEPSRYQTPSAALYQTPASGLYQTPSAALYGSHSVSHQDASGARPLESASYQIPSSALYGDHLASTVVAPPRPLPPPPPPPSPAPGAAPSTNYVAPALTDSLAMMDYFMKKAERGSMYRSPHDADREASASTQVQASAEEQKPSRRGHHMGDFIPEEELLKFTAKAAGTSVPSDQQRIDADNVGHKLLQKMGWKEGQGLGSKGSGMAAPIQAGDVKQDNLGIGAQGRTEVSADDDIYEQYKKRMMLGYKHRPNPLGNPRKAYY